MVTNFLKKSIGLGLTTSLVMACSPTPNTSVAVLENSNSIIGGAPVEEADLIGKTTVAIVANVVMADDQEGQFVCTGSMLKADVVLTAAHCVPEVGEDFKEVVLFVVFNRDLNTMTMEDVRLVVDHRIHDKYGEGGEFGEDINDFALLKLHAPMPQGYQLAKFLEDESLLKEGSTVTLAGYGLIETDGVNTKSDGKLRKVDVEIAGDFGKTEVALDQSNGKGACHGDSGGPALIDVEGTQYVWGITSRGAGKDGVDDCSLVSVYGKVKSQNEFITKALSELGH